MLSKCQPAAIEDGWSEFPPPFQRRCLEEKKNMSTSTPLASDLSGVYRSGNYGFYDGIFDQPPDRPVTQPRARSDSRDRRRNNSISCFDVHPSVGN